MPGNGWKAHEDRKNKRRSFHEEDEDYVPEDEGDAKSLDGEETGKICHDRRPIKRTKRATTRPKHTNNEVDGNADADDVEKVRQRLMANRKTAIEAQRAARKLKKKQRVRAHR